MEEIRESFIDGAGDELVINRETTGDMFIGIHESGYYSNFALTKKDIKAIRKALKKLLKEDGLS